MSLLLFTVILVKHPCLENTLNKLHKYSLSFLFLLHNQPNVLFFVGSFCQHSQDQLKKFHSFLSAKILGNIKQIDVFC